VTGAASEARREEVRARRAGWAEDGFPREEPDTNPGSWTDLLKDREDPKWDSFSWLTVRALFESVNDLLAKQRPEIVDERRARWVAGQRGRTAIASADLIFEPPQPGDSPPAERTFLLVGDTGEQDASQYALAPYLAPAAQEDSENVLPAPEFMVIVSDAIYPAGNVNEYVNGFYVPYRGFEKPIYAIPGNHDWYDGLEGFMYHFCGAEPLPSERFRETEIRPTSRLARRLWRGSEAPERDRLSRWRDSRPWGRDATKAVQPAPYYAIDLGDLLVVAIDTGVTGAIDDEQGRWLVRVSEQCKKQKILLTGKPIYVDGAYRPGPIAWKPSKREQDPPRFKTVDDVVRHQPFGYIAAIGGDVHNYQRYPVRLTKQRRTVHYIVSGGGGAYLSPTHRIPPVGESLREAAPQWPSGVDMPTDEDLQGSGSAGDPARAFRCYPRRGDSLAYTARRAGPRMFNAVQLAAAAFVAAASMLLYGLPLDWTGSLALVTAYLPLVLIGLIVLAARKLKAKLKRWQRSRQGRKCPRIRHFRLAATFLAVLLFALVASGVALASDRDLFADPRFWGMAGVALLVPVGLVAAVLLAHDMRGSTPTSLPKLAILGAFAAAIPILVPIGPVGAAPEWFVTATSLVLFAGAGMLILGAVESRLPGHVLAFAAPATLAAVLAADTDAARFLLFGAALVAPGAYAYVLSLSLGTHRPPAVHGSDLLARRLAKVFRLLSVLAWVTLATILLQLIGDGWVATAAIGSIAVLAMAVIAVLLIVLAFGTKLKYWIPVALAGALPLSRLLAIVASTIVASLAYVVVAVFLLAASLLCFNALRGRINAIRAQARIESLLDGGDGTTGVAPELSRKERDLFMLLYPYRWDRKQAQGAEKSGSLAQTIAKLAAELSDSDEPPFFKSFLRIDVRPRAGEPEEPDRELRIRCVGVTGYAREEADPPVEDDLSIPFLSARRFAASSAAPNR